MDMTWRLLNMWSKLVQFLKDLFGPDDDDDNNDLPEWRVW